METLLVVLVIGCALALAVHVGRGIWARARSVERHQQALDTLAGITNRPDVVAGSQASPGPAEELYEHQAHVRLIGPGGQASQGDSSGLPPPRAASALGATSPFRRPSRTSPSAAAMDAVATTAYLARSPGDKLVRTGTPLPALRQPAAPPPPDATLPGLPPDQAPYIEPPTRPVPIVQPQVFYFDDLSTRGEAPGTAANAAPSRSKLRRRDRRRARRQEAKVDEFEGAVYGAALADETVALHAASVSAADRAPSDLGISGLAPRGLAPSDQAPADASLVDTGPVDLISGPQGPLVAEGFVPEPPVYDPPVTGPVFRERAAEDTPDGPPTVVPGLTAKPVPAEPPPPAPPPAAPLVLDDAALQRAGPRPAVPEAVAAGVAASVTGASVTGASVAGDPTGTPPKSGRHAASPAPAPKRKTAGRAGRKSVVGVVLAVAAICVAVAAIGVTLLGLPGQGSPHHLAAGTTKPTTTKPHATTTSAPPTTTTSAPQKPAVLLSASGGTATYELRSASASIVVSATGPCWLEVRANSPLGQIIYEGILYAGQYSKVTGPAWIRLGNPPAVAVKVDGTVMAVPGAQSAVPLNLQFSFG
jgi:hypothetical protein